MNQPAPELNELERFEELRRKKRKLELLKRRKELRKKFGLLFYKPHKKQDAFHRAGKYRRRYMRAGNRFGKSDMGVAEDCAWLLGYRPWVAEGDEARRSGIPQRPVKGLVIAADWDKVREIFTEDKGENLGKIWRFIPADMVRSRRRNQNGVIEFIELENGSTLTFDTVKSFKTNPMGSESSDWDFIHVDEPCPEKMYKAQARGLVDRGGSAWFTLTPLSEPWIDDMFFPKRVDATLAPFILESRWAMQGSMHDNPYLSEEAKREYLDMLTPGERECREKGIPLEHSGRIYKEFSFDRHVLQTLPAGWTAFNNPPADYSIYIAVDPHAQTPFAVLMLAVSPSGHLFFFDEIFEHDSVERIAELINGRIAGRNVVRRIMDPHGYIEHPITMTSMEDEFEKYGLYFDKAAKDPQRGILAVQAALAKPDYIYFAPHLNVTIWEFERYIWDPNKPDKPRDKDDHMMENLYRLLLEEPVFIPRDDPSNQPITDTPIISGAVMMPDMFNKKYEL